GEMELTDQVILPARRLYLQAYLSERRHRGIVEVAREPVQEVVERVQGDAGRMHGERDERTDSAAPQARSLDGNERVPVGTQLLGARRAGVVRAGHRRGKTEERQGRQIQIGRA